MLTCTYLLIIHSECHEILHDHVRKNVTCLKIKKVMKLTSLSINLIAICYSYCSPGYSRYISTPPEGAALWGSVVHMSTKAQECGYF